MSAEQQLTNTATAEAEKRLSDQAGPLKTDHPLDHALHKTVRRPPRRSTRKSRSRRKVGGHRTTRFLTHEEWRDARNCAFAIVNAGYRWSILLTIRPHVSLPDAEKQERIQKFLGDLSQALKRHGQPYIRMRVYEKKRGGGSLHAHVLIYVRKEYFFLIERMVDKFDRGARKRIKDDETVAIHARVIGSSYDDLRQAILYPLKEHEFAGPGYDGSGSARMFYEKGDPIRGVRLSFSPQAEVIIAEYQKTLPAAVSVDPIAIPQTLAEPTQLSFGSDWITVDIRRMAEQERVSRGMTQAEAGAVIGYRQPGYSNTFVRRHDPLSPWARNRALEFIGTKKAA